jgi:DNA anti-recombination protein RmuC
MLAEEIAGHIADALATNNISASFTLNLIRRRVNGASSDQLLTAAIAVLREQASKIAELEARVSDLTEDNERLEDDVVELERALASPHAPAKELVP